MTDTTTMMAMRAPSERFTAPEVPPAAPASLSTPWFASLPSASGEPMPSAGMNSFSSSRGKASVLAYRNMLAARGNHINGTRVDFGIWEGCSTGRSDEMMFRQMSRNKSHDTPTSQCGLMAGII